MPERGLCHHRRSRSARTARLGRSGNWSWPTLHRRTLLGTHERGTHRAQFARPPTKKVGGRANREQAGSFARRATCKVAHAPNRRTLLPALAARAGLERGALLGGGGVDRVGGGEAEAQHQRLEGDGPALVV